MWSSSLLAPTGSQSTVRHGNEAILEKQALAQAIPWPSISQSCWDKLSLTKTIRAPMNYEIMNSSLLNSWEEVYWCKPLCFVVVFLCYIFFCDNKKLIKITYRAPHDPQLSLFLWLHLLLSGSLAHHAPAIVVCLPGLHQVCSTPRVFALPFSLYISLYIPTTTPIIFFWNMLK